MEAFAVRELVEKFEQRTLLAGISYREAHAGGTVHHRLLRWGSISIARKQTQAIVPLEVYIEGQVDQPGRGACRSIKVDLAHLRGEIMRIAKLFERGASAYCERLVHEVLKR